MGDTPIKRTGRPTKADRLAVYGQARALRFFQCPQCDCYHQQDFWGDCRQDEERFTIDELDAAYGALGWIEIAPEDAGY